MNEGNAQDLKRRYESWSSDALLNALKRWPEYQAEALSIIQAVLSDRALTEDEKKLMETAIAQRTSAIAVEDSPRIRPSLGHTMLGIVGIAIALPLALRAIFILILALQARHSAETAYGFGGAIALIVFAVAILKWGFAQFQSIKADDAVALLASPDAATWQFVAKALVRFKWIPHDNTQRSRLLVGTAKYKDAIAMGDEGIEAMVEMLQLKYAPSDKILNELSQTENPLAIGLLIELLNKKTTVSRRKVARTLSRMTQENFGIDYAVWRSWLRSRQGP